MKPHVTLSTAFVAFSTLAYPSGIDAREAIIGISPFGTVEEKTSEIKKLGAYVLETIVPGEKAVIVNAYDQSEIATFALPNDGKSYSSARAKQRANADFYRNTLAFAKAAITPSGEHFEGQIDISAFLRTVGQNYPTNTERDLILYDVSPVSDSSRDPAHSTKDGVVPSDAHIPASRADSPFGAAEQSGKLANYTVHWGLSDTSWIVSDRHAFYTERFMALSATARGATLATFAEDPDTALRNAKSGLSTPVGDFELDMDVPISMIHFRPTVIDRTNNQADATTSTKTDVVSATTSDVPVSHGNGTIYDRPLSERIPEVGEITNASNVEIAIRWICDCDFDLAVKPEDGEIISFRTPLKSGGRLFKDFTSSKSLNNGWETVALSGEVNLQKVLIAVNLFRGWGGTKKVELRVAINGETWGKRFGIPGRADNGDGFQKTLNNGQPANPSWIVPTIAEILEAK